MAKTNGGIMGQILILLAQRDVNAQPDCYKTRLQIEDNVNEEIHLHFRNLRLEFSREEFLQFSSACKEAHDRVIENDKQNT